jgi:DNA-binding response OmpR family regulator
MKVLIVEDRAEMRGLIKRFIRDQVDEFIECEDGSEAVTAYDQHRPDIVLMDTKMREVDGFEATREIKAAFSDARVVIVSQLDSPALRETARMAGAEKYIIKSDLMPLREYLAGAKAVRRNRPKRAIEKGEERCLR